ncbi:MAG: MBL fold metallo-hydrolase [Bacilli bacterium]|nr:MBL fold metallo-hydrolase [Bacilli bacterium]
MKKDTKRLLTLLIILAYILINILDSSYSQRPINEEIIVNEMKPTIVYTNLTIQYLDVGQAESILISNNNRHMLIDAGNNEDGPKIVNYLKSLGIETLDYIIATHPHEDHIGGMDDVIRNFNVNNVYMPEVYSLTTTFEEVINELENKKLQITIPKINEEISFGEGVLRFIYSGKDSEDMNNASIIIKMMFGTTSYLFTGDTTSKIENEILTSDINVDVLKVAHHGSEYSTNNEFLKRVTPSYAIISVGKNNDYNHPSINTLNRIKNYTNRIYRTDELGTIIITSDGKNINVESIYTDTNG